MTPVRDTPPAAEDLYRITRYIRRDKPEAGRNVARTICDSCESLIHSPNRGRIGVEPGTRELGVAPLPYIVVYRVIDDTVEILRIWHGAQQRNKQ